MLIVTRPLRPDDEPFLREMVLLAAFPPGPVPAEARKMAHVRRWLDDWGRASDTGVVAWNGPEPVGAAWCRQHDRPVAHGVAGEALPEVGIAVVPAYRRRGVGMLLLQALDGAATGTGISGLSLTVNVWNPALRLYERAGYERVATEGDRVVMVKQLGN